MSWTPAHMPDQRGKTFVITGANSGIGLEAARLLACRGAHVVMACRSQHKAEAAMADVRAACSSAELSFVALDLADLGSVRRAADTLRERHDPIDALVNNAGVMALPRRLTADGFEMQLGTNHLGHFALTARLLDRVEAADAGRIVNVSSLVHRVGRIDFDDPMGERRYNKWTAYAQSKLANLLFTLELHRRLRDAGRKTIVTACHPGYASTNLQTAGAKMTGKAMAEAVMRLGNRLFAQSANQGAWPTVRAATDPDATGGTYYGPGGLARLRGTVTRETPATQARDPEAARRLWTLSESLTGVSFEF